jgi:nanoRNase/pAp phosphatase (c-di-AMP/oligoRNAs hydrolase)/CBS domain-containing protein
VRAAHAGKKLAESPKGEQMDIAVTHTNTDFDALASLVAATFLHPGAVGVLPNQLKRNVKEFLAIHRNLFKLCSVKDLDLSDVSRLIVVDTNNWSRLERIGDLRERDNLEILMWDHHMKGGNIEPTWKCQKETGSTITLMVEEMKERDCAFMPMHATLFLLGLYEDTGNLSYPSVTPEDAYAAGFLLENGADLHVAAAYLSSSFDSEHTEVLTTMLQTSQTLEVAGHKIGLSCFRVESGLNMLSSVVARYKEIKGVDAAIGVFNVERDKCMIIGCGGSRGFDIGALMRRFGGGGHPGAGSALIKGASPDEAYQRVKEMIGEEMDRPSVCLRDIMSRPRPCLSPATSLGEARSLMEKENARSALVAENGRYFGIITELDCRKAKTESRLKSPIKAFARRNMPVASPEQSAKETLRLMVEANTELIPVIENDQVIGVVTWADLMLHIYEL